MRQQKEKKLRLDEIILLCQSKDLGVQGKTIVQESKSYLKHEENWICWHMGLLLELGTWVASCRLVWAK